jgi:hypothetical protein
MSRIKKSLARLLEGRSDANFDFDELCLILARSGFTLRRGQGSHHIFFKESVEEILNLQPRGSKAKPYQVKQVRDLILKYQLEID